MAAVSTPALTMVEWWCLLDTRVFLLKNPASSPTAMAASCTTSNERTVRASLRVAAGPHYSIMELYTDDEVLLGPKVVATSGDLFLIHMVVPFKERRIMKSRHNFFVFNTNPEWRPSMRALPPPPDWVAQGKDTGIIDRGEGEFVVASLMPRVVVDRSTGTEVEVEVAFVWIFRSDGPNSSEWEIRKLDMPHDPDEGLVEFHWQTDAVFSFNESFICWADYHRGILLCNVCDSDPKLRFLRFPGIEIWRCGDRADPTRFRTVTVCNGSMKFVDVDNGRFRSTADSSSENSDVSIGSDSDDNESFFYSNVDGCSITTWTLKVPEYEWEVDSVLQLEEIWSHQSYLDSPLPYAVPTFPVFNILEPNILNFIVKGPAFFDNAWMVAIDMKKKSLGPYQLYDNLVMAEGDGTFDLSHVYPNSPMISSTIIRCINFPALSRKNC